MNHEERLALLISRTEKLGLELRLENGMLTVRFTRTLDDDLLESVMSDLAARCAEVRKIVELRTVEQGAKEFLGSRVWASDLGEGTLSGSDPTHLFVRVRREGSLNFTHVTANANTIVILDERPAEPPVSEASQQSADPAPRKAGLVQQLRTAFRGEA